MRPAYPVDDTQAVYFGMKPGQLPEHSSPDAIIAGTERDPSTTDEDPPDGLVEEEAEPAMASSSGRAGAE